MIGPLMEGLRFQGPDADTLDERMSEMLRLAADVAHERVAATRPYSRERGLWRRVRDRLDEARGIRARWS